MVQSSDKYSKERKELKKQLRDRKPKDITSENVFPVALAQLSKNMDAMYDELHDDLDIKLLSRIQTKQHRQLLIREINEHHRNLLTSRSVAAYHRLLAKNILNYHQAVTQSSKSDVRHTPYTYRNRNNYSGSSKNDLKFTDKTDRLLYDVLDEKGLIIKSLENKIFTETESLTDHIPDENHLNSSISTKGNVDSLYISVDKNYKQLYESDASTELQDNVATPADKWLYNDINALNKLTLYIDQMTKSLADEPSIDMLERIHKEQKARLDKTRMFAHKNLDVWYSNSFQNSTQALGNVPHMYSVVGTPFCQELAMMTKQ